MVWSEFLPRRPEENFVDVHVVRLTNREGDRAVMLLGNSVATAPREMIVVRRFHGLTSCRRPSEITTTLPAMFVSSVDMVWCYCLGLSDRT